MSSMIWEELSSHWGAFKVVVTYPLLKGAELAWSEGIGFSNDGNHIDTGRETSHQLNVHFTEPSVEVSVCGCQGRGFTYACPVGGIKYKST